MHLWLVSTDIVHVYAGYMSELGGSKVVYQSADSDGHKEVRLEEFFPFYNFI